MKDVALVSGNWQAATPLMERRVSAVASSAGGRRDCGRCECRRGGAQISEVDDAPALPAHVPPEPQPPEASETVHGAHELDVRRAHAARVLLRRLSRRARTLQHGYTRTSISLHTY